VRVRQEGQYTRSNAEQTRTCCRLFYVDSSSAVESCDQVVEISSPARETLDAIARTIFP
jgi:hypothetical protein